MVVEIGSFSASFQRLPNKSEKINQGFGVKRGVNNFLYVHYLFQNTGYICELTFFTLMKCFNYCIILWRSSHSPVSHFGYFERVIAAGK